MSDLFPHRIGSLPIGDSVGRMYALYDHDVGREVLGAMIACWPDRGPTWAIRLHELNDEGRPVTVFLYDRPESKLGRWHVIREMPTSKLESYQRLVTARKSCWSAEALNLANPSRVDDGRYDSNEVGPWTRWAGDLDADIMVVGQDWGDVAYFIETRGLDAANNPTNLSLFDLLKSIDRPVSYPPVLSDPRHSDSRQSTGVFLTNALLWLKTGGMQAAVRPEWFMGDSATFLKEQIAIVQPRVVVALGQRAYNAVLGAYDLPVARGRFRDIVEQAGGVALPGMPGATLLFGVYHCGARVRNTTRSTEQQLQDWTRVTKALRPPPGSTLKNGAT